MLEGLPEHKLIQHSEQIEIILSSVIPECMFSHRLTVHLSDLIQCQIITKKKKRNKKKPHTQESLKARVDVNTKLVNT